MLTDNAAPASQVDGPGSTQDDFSDGKDSDKDSKKKKNRCANCRKKVGLTGESNIQNMSMSLFQRRTLIESLRSGWGVLELVLF